MLSEERHQLEGLNPEKIAAVLELGPPPASPPDPTPAAPPSLSDGIEGTADPATTATAVSRGGGADLLAFVDALLGEELAGRGEVEKKQKKRKKKRKKKTDREGGGDADDAAVIAGGSDGCPPDTGALAQAWAAAGVWADPMQTTTSADEKKDATAAATDADADDKGDDTDDAKEKRDEEEDEDDNEEEEEEEEDDTDDDDDEEDVFMRDSVQPRVIKVLETPATQRGKTSTAAREALGIFLPGGGGCSRIFGPNPGGANLNVHVSAGSGAGAGSAGCGASGYGSATSGLSPLAATIAANTAAAANAAARVPFDIVARKSAALVAHVEFSIPDAGFAIDEVPVPMFLDRRGGGGGSGGGGGGVSGGGGGMAAIAAGFRRREQGFSGGVGGGGGGGGGGGALDGLIRRARLTLAPPLSTNARLNLAWKLPAAESLLSRRGQEFTYVSIHARTTDSYAP